MRPHPVSAIRMASRARLLPGPRHCCLALAITLALLPGRAQAQLPAGAQLVSGNADITTAGGVMTVSNNPNTIIDWQDFSIGAENRVHFAQQAASSQVLNRVIGQDESLIHGRLSSNGRVWLINPNGVLFGKGASVDVAGLVASTLNVSPADFLQGVGVASADLGKPGSPVVNQGAIAAVPGGSIWLLGSSVRNEGLVLAPGGQILLAAGKQLDFVDAAAPRLVLRLSAPENEAINLGSLMTSGPQSGIQILGAIVNQQGVVRADHAELDPAGRIVLRSSGDLLLGGQSLTSTRVLTQEPGGPAAPPDQLPSEPVVPDPASHAIELDAVRIELESGARVTSDAAGDTILVRSNSFRNLAGPEALMAPNGRWLIHTDGIASTQLGGLPYDFVQFDVGPDTGPGQASGNALLYAQTLSLQGRVSRIYDGTAIARLDAATAFSGVPAGYQVSLAVPGEGSFDDKQVGTNKRVTVTTDPVLKVNSAETKPVYGYTVHYQGDITSPSLDFPLDPAQDALRNSDAAIATVQRLAQPPSDPLAGPGLLDLSALAPGQLFGPVRISAMSQADLAGWLDARRAFKTRLFADSISRLEIDSSLANVQPCSSAEEAGSGNCRITAEQIAQVQAERQAMPVAPRQAALPQIERKIAVLFGINDYGDSRIPKLESAIPDVDALARVLSASLGYEARVLRNPGKADIVRALNQLATELGPSDSVLVYYAGHGYALQRQGPGYWIAADAPADDPRRWLSNHDIARLLADYPARQLALVSDSCYSGAFAREAIDAGAQQLDVREVLGKRSVVVLTSGGDEPVTDEGREGHSIFSWHLMQSLASLRGWTAGHSIFRQVQAGVIREFPQTPQYGAVTEAGHQRGGEYLFEVR